VRSSGFAIVLADGYTYTLEKSARFPGDSRACAQIESKAVRKPAAAVSDAALAGFLDGVEIPADTVMLDFLA